MGDALAATSGRSATSWRRISSAAHYDHGAKLGEAFAPSGLPRECCEARQLDTSSVVGDLPTGTRLDPVGDGTSVDLADVIVPVERWSAPSRGREADDQIGATESPVSTPIRCLRHFSQPDRKRAQYSPPGTGSQSTLTAPTAEQRSSSPTTPGIPAEERTRFSSASSRGSNGRERAGTGIGSR